MRDEKTNETSDGRDRNSGPGGTIEQGLFRVVIVNDDSTPMEFVVRALIEIFQKTQDDAERIMLMTHHTGKGMCGVYSRTDAESLVDRMTVRAGHSGHPLHCLIEPDSFSDPLACELPLASKEWRILTYQGSLRDLPAIVLEAGGGCARGVWRIVQEQLARRTLVVSYDRAGLGGNTEWPPDASAAGVVVRLAALLARTAVPAPYLLVGHSLGGLFVQYYAAKHPAVTAGLVLVDSTHTDHARMARRLQDFSPGGRLWDPSSAAVRELAAIGTSQILVRRHPVPRQVPILAVTAGNLPENVKSSLSSDEFAEFQAQCIQLHKNTAAQSAVGRHVLMPEADHSSILLNAEHAAVLVCHILEFAETFCRGTR